MRKSCPVPVLVADDDRDILMYFRAVLSGAGDKLHLVSSGGEALETAKKNEIAIAFIDVNMPEMDGIETLVHWKKIRPNTKIIMISAYSDQNLVRKAIQEGADAYLFKPLNGMDIFSIIFKVLKELGIEDAISYQ